MSKSTAWMVLAVLAVLAIVAGLIIHRQERHAGQDAQPPAARSGDSNSTRSGKSAFPRPFALRTDETGNESNIQLDQLLALKLPREAIEDYLRRHQRSAASLLAAYHASGDAEHPDGDLNYLKEAATNFPGDPHVQLAVLTQDAFPEAQRQWLDAFKASSPSNSLANYLSAGDYLKTGQPEAAAKELMAAASKPQFDNLTMETWLDEKELYRENGKSPLEADEAAGVARAVDMLPELAGLKEVAQGVLALQQQKTSSGDSAAAENLAQANLALASRLSGGDNGKPVINQLVGLAIENLALSSLEPNSSYAFLGGETPSQRMAELKQEKVSIQQLRQSCQSIAPSLTETEQENFMERANIFGELATMRWLVEQHGSGTPSQSR